MIRADLVHVEHLLRKLFRNSLEHRSDDVFIRICDLPDGFYVKDNIPRISEELWRGVAKADFTTKADGSGLDPTFVEQLAKAYGCQWRIGDSEAGKARFEFTAVEPVSTVEETHH